MPDSEINRSIYYYDLYTRNKIGDTDKYDYSSKLIKQFLMNLKEKQDIANDYEAFLKPTRNGNNEFLIVDNINDGHIRFRIVLCKNDALPFIEKKGNLETLGSYIDSDQSIAEITHCIYFYEYGILGAEYNASGARATSIVDYLHQFELTEGLITCRHKLNFDAYTKLIDDEEFTLFDFAVKSNSDAYNNVLANKSIFSSIQKTIPEADTFEVVLKKKKTKKNKFSGFLLPFTKDETKKLLENYREDLVKFKVSQDSITDSIDLLSDKFVNKVTLVRTAERTIDSTDMYSKIQSYFDGSVAQYCKKI
jgi:hypothetical protein